LKVYFDLLYSHKAAKLAINYRQKKDTQLVVTSVM